MLERCICHLGLVVNNSVTTIYFMQHILFILFVAPVSVDCAVSRRQRWLVLAWIVVITHLSAL